MGDRPREQIIYCTHTHTPERQAWPQQDSVSSRLERRLRQEQQYARHWRALQVAPLRQASEELQPLQLAWLELQMQVLQQVTQR